MSGDGFDGEFDTVTEFKINVRFHSSADGKTVELIGGEVKAFGNLGKVIWAAMPFNDEREILKEAQEIAARMAKEQADDLSISRGEES